MPTERLFDTIDQINLKNLSKKYGNQHAVNDLSLNVDGGELLILIGGSGSGKTTTLKMINRLIKPDSGTIKINNTDITTINEVILRRNIGYVIQQIGLFPHMTIHENIGLIPRLENWSKQKIDTRITELLRLVDLPPETFQHRYPKELSGGQQQRIGLARALTMDPRLLLMDEPFGALDPILRRQLHEEFLNLKKELHRTIIFVTHDINEAFKLGDRIAVMDHGKLQQVDTPQELLLNPANDIVSTLVDADHKFRHLDTLTAQDIMTKIQPQYIQPHTQTIKQLEQHFTQHNIERIFITKKSEFIGWISFKDILNNESKSDTIEQYITSAVTFSANDSMSAILHEMKQKQYSIAVVIKNKKPIGFLIPDEVLLKLI